jgi:hypothetical protein
MAAAGTLRKHADKRSLTLAMSRNRPRMSAWDALESTVSFAHLEFIVEC